MDKLNEYIKRQYDNDLKWFEQEVNQHNHNVRINKAISNKEYLSGKHKVRFRQDSKYKGKILVTKKILLQYAKTVLRFHSTYLLGKQVSLSCEDEKSLETFSDIYRLGQYATTDYQILNNVNKYGNAYEYVYVEDGVIKSKVLDSTCSYPVYDDMGNYVAFIEHWTDVYTKVAYYDVYYPTYVEHWCNEGGELQLIGTNTSVGLPVHYHNFDDEDDNFGRAFLDDVIPIMDELEDIMSKMGDSIYVNVLNPMPVAVGQRIESSIPSDACGYVMNLDAGEFKYANCSLDYNSVKLYIDNLKQLLNDVSCIPSILSSNSSIANISEVSMQILLMMANVLANENMMWLNTGFQKRFKLFSKILSMQGIKVNSDVRIKYNLSMPVANTEIINNLKSLKEMGAISVETILENVEYVSDVNVEMSRLSGNKGVGEQKNNGGEVLKNTDKVE